MTEPGRPSSEDTSLDVSLCSGNEDFAAWDRHLYQLPGAHYFQTYGWLRSYVPMGFNPEVLVARAGGAIVGGVGYLTARVPGLPWRIAIIPHGPVPAEPDAGFWQVLMDSLDEHLRAAHTVYAQIYPHERSEETTLVRSLEARGFSGPPLFSSHRFSSTPVLVTLAGRTEDDVLQSLRKKTRQYVRRSQEAGLQLRTEVSPALLEQIYVLLQENGELLGYEARPYSSLRAVWDWFAPRGWATFLQAWHGETLVGAILQVYTGCTAYYLAGAVRRGYHAQCPAEFLHWAAIREGLRRGMETYDMVNLGSPGVEQFKRGFRPEVRSWHEPRTKIYAPAVAHTLHALETWLRPLVRRIGRIRARRGRPSQPIASGEDGSRPPTSERATLDRQ